MESLYRQYGIADSVDMIDCHRGLAVRITNSINGLRSAMLLPGGVQVSKHWLKHRLMHVVTHATPRAW